MHNLNISLVQTTLHWEDPEKNRQHFSALLQDVPSVTELVVLPEMFSTGFSMDAERIAEDADGPTRLWLEQEAKRMNCAIAGSMAVRDSGGIYNRLRMIGPDGQEQYYDKKHLFRMSGEQNHYTAGKQRKIFKLGDWRLCAQVCYDLRFPVWSRDQDDYDLLLYVANWPAKRAQHWRSLLLARAIENQSFCIGVNRVGKDGNGILYSGDSIATSADGLMLKDCEDGDGVFSCELDAETRANYRRKFPCHLDRDHFQLSEE